MLESILPFFSFEKLALAINLLNLDYDVGLALGIGEFAGGILITLLMVFVFCSLPIWKKSYGLAMILGILILCFGIAVAWLNVFVLIIIVFAIALGLADKLTGILGGKL